MPGSHSQASRTKEKAIFYRHPRLEREKKKQKKKKKKEKKEERQKGKGDAKGRVEMAKTIKCSPSADKDSVLRSFIVSRSRRRHPPNLQGKQWKWPPSSVSLTHAWAEGTRHVE
ncbi:hypothetical protein MUK42_27748 [Musa troglodytarum]|uniref:Uncharacterized protein n=1 Tax=Musa troglodytarum TaxID=320322 RepID=A0A9E7JPA4_9LILI|nr:hypothetical protein MUK42_27748 [Musa troglodytarum]